MSFGIVFDSEASAEFREAVAWYEERAMGLGVRFTLEVDKVIAVISSRPLRFSRSGREGRRARIRGWPYAIHFVINEAHAEIKVIAIWHDARNPTELRRRMK